MADSEGTSGASDQRRLESGWKAAGHWERGPDNKGVGRRQRQAITDSERLWAHVYTVAWSPDGNRLAAGGDDHTATLWNAVSGEGLITLKGHTDDVHSVAWSPDGKRLATASSDQTAKVWTLRAGRKWLHL